MSGHGQFEWGVNDSVVVCGYDPLKPGGCDSVCELCGGGITMFPSTMEKCVADPAFHALCHGCANAILDSQEFLFSGKVKANGDRPWRPQ